MAFLTSMDIIGSGMTAQQTRLDVISENITNMNTTRTEGGGAYRRKITVMESESGRDDFRLAMSRVAGREVDIKHSQAAGRDLAEGLELPRRGRSYTGVSNRGYETAGGVRVTEIREDDSELPLVYDPAHPDANEEGYVEMPNVTLIKEVADAMSASQAFSADVTAFNTLKQVVSRGLEISE